MRPSLSLPTGGDWYEGCCSFCAETPLEGRNSVLCGLRSLLCAVPPSP